MVFFSLSDIIRPTVVKVLLSFHRAAQFSKWSRAKPHSKRELDPHILA